MNINKAFPSTYLKQEDLGDKRVTVTMDRVAIEKMPGDEAETKPVLYFQGKEKGLALNRTNAQEIAMIVGDDETDRWRGHQIVLYVDPRIMFGGKRVGGIRVMAPQPPGGQAPPPPPPPPAEFSASDDDVPF